MTSGASLFEFMLTPFLGALSDKVGRRPVMLGAAGVCTVARLVTYVAGWGVNCMCMRVGAGARACTVPCVQEIRGLALCVCELFARHL